MTFTLAISGKTLTMTSREIADLTGKQHAHVMRDIRDMIERFEESADPNLDWHCVTEHYIDLQGKPRENQRSHFVMGPRAVLKPDLPPAVTRRRWNG